MDKEFNVNMQLEIDDGNANKLMPLASNIIVVNDSV